MPEIIDRKFRFEAVSINSGNVYTQRNALVFLLKDALLPALLDKYVELCLQAGVSGRQIAGIHLLKDRVLKWQRRNIKKVCKPDVDEGSEERRVCRPNK